MSMEKNCGMISTEKNATFIQHLSLAILSGGIRQTEIQTVEPFVPGSSISELEVAIGKLKSYVARC
jgi:hypothetical protein